MPFKGTFNTSLLTQDLAKKSFAAQIARLMPNGSAPLFGLTALLGDETALSFEHGYFAKTMIFPSAVITTAGTAGTSVGVGATVEENIVVDSTANIVEGMILQVMNDVTSVPTKENILVLTVVNSTTLSVRRNLQGITLLAGMAANQIILQVGNASEEASVRPTALGIVPVRITNLTQIFRNTWAISGTSSAVQVIAGDSTIAENRMDCAAFHAADIERAIFFGRKSSGTKNNQPLRTMDGLVSLLGDAANYPAVFGGATNVYTAGATTNATELEAMLDPVFNQATDPKSANERLMFVGGTGLRVINNIGKKNGTYQLVDGQTNWGLQFHTFKSARGSFKIIEHPMFNSNAYWAKMAVVVDPASIRLAYLGNRKTQNQEYNQTGTPVDNGVDAAGGTLTTETTLVCKNVPANAVVYNLTAAAVG